MFNYGRYIRGLCHCRFSAWYVCFTLLKSHFSKFFLILVVSCSFSSNAFAYWTKHPYGVSSGWITRYSGTCSEFIETKPRKTMEGLTDWVLISRQEAGATYENDFRYETSLWCNYKAVLWRGDACPDSNSPSYPSTECEPEPILCSDPQVQKDIQQAQYACQLSQPSDLFHDNEFKWSCSENPAPQYPNVSTSCNLVPKDCIQGLTCEEPSDTPHCNPANEECPLPPPTPDLNPDDPNNPNPDPSFCELHPQLCETPTAPPSTPEPNPSPGSGSSPDNPDMSVGENANNKELSESNQHLENINHNIKELDKRVIDQLLKANQLAQHQLGELKEIRNKPTGGGGAGTTQAVTEGNQKLDDIACLLDDKCESEDKEKPTANVDCDKSIFECKGDVIQCALLKVQYEDTCTIDELKELEAAFSTVVNVDNEAMLVQPDVVDFGKLNTTYLDNGVAFSVSATCPAPQTTSLQGKTIEISFEPACRYAELVRPLVIFSAWLTGLLLIGRSQGMV